MLRQIVLHVKVKISLAAKAVKGCRFWTHWLKNSPVQGLRGLGIVGVVGNAQLCGYYNLNCVA